MIKLESISAFESRWNKALELAESEATVADAPPSNNRPDASTLALFVRMPPSHSPSHPRLRQWSRAMGHLLSSFELSSQNLGHDRRVHLAAATEPVKGDGPSLFVVGGDAWRLESSGALGYFLEWAIRNGDVRVERAFPVGSRRFLFDGGRAPMLAAYAVWTAASWWSAATFAEASSLMERIRIRIADGLDRLAVGHPWRSSLSREALYAHLLELELEGVWELARLFGGDGHGELEIEGWSREFEAAFRARRPDLFMPFAVSLRPPTAVDGGEPVESGRLPTIDLGGYIEPDNSDRTEIEALRRLGLRWGLSPNDAKKALAPVKGTLRPAEGSDSSNSVLYFAYGSCMCRSSFRETVPRYELVGPALLKGYRLAFTYKSTARGGGVADLVEDAASHAWGTLFRVPRRYLDRLDEREGVPQGYYQRAWIEVEAQGTTLAPVLTYTVVAKSHAEVPPTPEYAGLIFDGARGMLPQTYLTWLLEKFGEFDVEPALPD